MDLEKQKNHKFNFFKSTLRRRDLSSSNLTDPNYITLFIVSLWIISGMFFKIEMRNQPVQPAPIQAVASVAMNPVNAEEKLKFITQVKSLKFAKNYEKNTPQLLKEISKELNMRVTKFETEEGVLEVQGYLVDSKQKLELVFEDDNIGVKWIKVTLDEIKLFTNTWKGKTETEIRTNYDNTQEIVLIANVLRMNENLIAVPPSSKIQSLQSQVEKLQQENNKLKKDNAQLVVKKAIKENPHLKNQEKQIQKFVDSLLEASKEK